MMWKDIKDITVLVAEDDAFNRKLINAMLSKNKKIKILEAVDGVEALSQLDKHKIDALLLDIHMPNMNGLDTLKNIRQHAEHKDLPVIVITSDEVEKKKSFSLGANGFLPKPFKLNDLEKKVYSVLGDEKK